MIKVLINNEEVVSNSNLEIKEEMLSTSSTILKNCYPKVWENDKDYVSRFYYPKDYSKCKIYNLPRENTTQEQTGTNLSFETYLGKSTIEDIKFYGNTLQDGTPTPDTPVEIQSVTGLQNVSITSENLKNENNIFNGYLNDTEGIVSNNNNRITYIQIESNKTYNIKKVLSKRFRIGLTNSIPSNNLAINNYVSLDNQTSYTFTNTNYKYLCIWFWTNQDTLTKQQVLDSINIYTDSNTYEVNLGKNLIYTSPKTYLGIEFTYNSNTGETSISGTASSTYAVAQTIQCNLPPGTYTLSIQNTYNFSIGIGIYINGRRTPKPITSGNKSLTFTTNGTITQYDIYITSLTTGENYSATFKLQLEKGSVATSFSPYFTPIELNKIGNYQDYIRKSTGKNLFDKDNANVLNAYFNSSTPTITSDSGERTLYIPCKPNTTYTVSKTVTNRFCAGYTTTTPTSGTSVSGVVQNHTASSITITTGATAQYLVVFYWISTDTKTSNEVLATIQIEENSQATDLEPYGVGKWYICNKTGKAVLNGTENWDSWYVLDNSNIGFYNYITNALTNNNETAINNRALCNKFSEAASRNSIRNGVTENYKMCGSSEPYLAMSLAKTKLSDYSTKALAISSFKTWLSNNKPEIYYVLATPTVEEITNEELINQLENLNIELYEGQTNFIISGSLPMPTYIKIYTNFEELIFCGFTKNTGNVSLNPRQFHGVDLQILDFKDLLSTGETLNYVIANKTIIEAINQVVNSISDYGFVVGEIQLLNPDETIGAYSTLNKTAYDVFQYFAEITQSRWTTRLIDENTIAIDFYDPSLMPTGVDIDKTQTFYENYKIIDMSFNYSTNDYRNKQIMTSDEVYANITQTETIIADGYATSFMCQNKIGLITSITLNGVEKTFATKSEEQLGITADFVYQPGDTTFTSNNSISAGGVIVITYYPIVKGREIILNNTESDRIESQINRNGTISRYENRNDTTSSQELQKIGQSYIKYKGNAEINLKIVSELNTWNVGEIVSYNAPISELSTTYMVKSKQISMYLNANKIIYTYNLTSNYNCENAVNYFDNQRAKNQGNIGEGETITRNIDLESTALIKFYDTNVEEIQVQNPTSLDFTLDGVLI